jgi:hypothetical protein
MSFLGFLGGILKGGISVATHGLINLGGGGSGGGVPSAAALPSVPFRTLTSGGSFGLPAAGAGGMRIPAFAGGSSPGSGSSLLPHFACDRGMHHAKVRGHHLLASKCVRNRRMNVANPRALRRSIRRLYGAEKMYARLLRVTHPQKIRSGRVHPKPPTRRRK